MTKRRNELGVEADWIVAKATTQFVNVSCWGKIAWSSVREAQTALRRRYRKPVPVGKRNDGHTTLYRCKICQKYHVGGGPEID